MKRQHILLLFAFFLMLDLSDGDGTLITSTKRKQEVDINCEGGTWVTEETSSDKLTLPYNDVHSKIYTCKKNEKNHYVLVRLRTCENCMEVNPFSLGAIVIGNILATALVGWAVYSISAQPKNKNTSRNKASDRVNLINNGEGSTYQELNRVDMSEYSRLGGVRQKH